MLHVVLVISDRELLAIARELLDGTGGYDRAFTPTIAPIKSKQWRAKRSAL